ncbi:MAG: hypothetical protein C5B60_07410 [Chloroflexi bacterium]|nr:MAG: hypothetical protein C5B60_07410 [Chloroflexota bacterium]
MPVSEVAAGAVESLKTQPATFAMIIMSFGLLGYTWYTSSGHNTQQFQMSQLMLSHQNETQQILSRCIEPAQVQTIIDQLGRDRQAYTDQLRRNLDQTQNNSGSLEQILQLLKKPVEQRGGELEHHEQHGAVEDGHGG